MTTIRATATFSPCRRYRYALTRSWGDDPRAVVFCGLNPSTADETQDDPTIRREIAFAKAWGYGALIKVNAYAFRSTDPKGLWRVDDPVGPENLHEILSAATWFMTDLFVAAWGTNIRSEHQDYLMRQLSANGVTVHALRLTKHGYPSHPLYLPQTLRPFAWQEARQCGE